MAATAVYCTISGAGATPPLGPPVAFSGITATTAPFYLLQGRLAIQVAATSFGTVTLELLLPDGTTYVAAPGVAAFAANGAQIADLPGGTYMLVLA